MKGILTLMAERGQLLEMSCEIPKCYSHRRRHSFGRIGTMPDDWTPSADHYPHVEVQGRQTAHNAIHGLPRTAGGARPPGVMRLCLVSLRRCQAWVLRLGREGGPNGVPGSTCAQSQD
jgi:hypothetical protein